MTLNNVFIITLHIQLLSGWQKKSHALRIKEDRGKVITHYESFREQRVRDTDVAF
jgi:hypothetical protein